MARIALLLPLAVALLVAAVLPAAGSASHAGKCQRPASATLVKAAGKGRVWSRPVAGDARVVVYVACSTRYGKKVVTVRNASESVDQDFTLESIALGSEKATIVACRDFAEGSERETVVANLKTGRATSKVEDVAGGCPVG